MSATEGASFTGSNRPAAAPGGSSASGASSDAGSNTAADAGTSEDSLKAVEEEMLYGDEEILTESDKVDEPSADGEKSDAKDDTTTTETQDSTEGGEGTPTPNPDASDANAGGKKVRNILLGGLGVLVLGAGIFLILLGKKKEEEE